MQETLGKVEDQLRELERGPARAYAALAEQVGSPAQTSEQLRTETQALVTALRAPQVRGRWGELQLRRVVELAGMAGRCDFDEQATVGTDGRPLRPDLVVRLAGGKNIVVDSKVSLAAYLEAAEATRRGRPGGPAGRARPAPARARRPAGGQGVLGARSARRRSSSCCSCRARRSSTRRWSTTRRCWSTR